MPRWNRDTPLKDGMRPNPVVQVQQIDLDALGVFTPSELQLMKVFEGTSSHLQTWGRSKDAAGKIIKENDAHWICVKQGIYMHTDTGYPRYTYQLKLRVDEGTYTVGVNGERTPLLRGTFYTLDTHSPHQIIVDTPGSLWNASASIDSKELLDPSIVLPQLIEYARITDFVTGEPHVG